MTPNVIRKLVVFLLISMECSRYENDFLSFVVHCALIYFFGLPCLYRYAVTHWLTSRLSVARSNSGQGNSVNFESLHRLLAVCTSSLLLEALCYQVSVLCARRQELCGTNVRLFRLGVKYSEIWGGHSPLVRMWGYGVLYRF